MPQKLEVWAKNLGGSGFRKPLLSVANDVYSAANIVSYDQGAISATWIEACLPSEWIEMVIVNIAQHRFLNSR